MNFSLPAALAAAALLAAAGTAHAQADPLQVRSWAAACANCHGTNGAARGDMKPLAGMSAGRIVAMVADFKSGAQPATIMHQIAKGYTDAEIDRLAAWFAAQKR